jgi:flavin-dependent dehydrogenase
MANGSWEVNPGDGRRGVKRPSDLFAFKATFSRSQLAAGVLPVISFAGGYGGLVIAENGELTLAGCIRRDALRACRVVATGQSAGEAFERCLRANTAALRDVLAGARREGAWLGIGPIQPGIRAPWSRADGRFMIGNAAAEAHPIIGEGISMAMQSAWLLCAGLVASGRSKASVDTLERVGAEYASQWREAFAPRLHLAATLAHLAMRPWLAPIVWPIIARAPWLMTAMARGAGKARIPPAFRGALPLDRLASLEDAN